MSWDPVEDARLYVVLVDVEDRYHTWPLDQEIPFGFTSTGKTGTKEECLAYIEEVWTDMRPRSIVEAARGHRPPD